MIKHSLILFFFVTTGLLSGQIIFTQIEDVQAPNDNLSFSTQPQAPENNDLTRTIVNKHSERVLATVTVVFENGETEFYENVENEFIESLENVLNVIPGSPEESTIPEINIQEEVTESGSTENVIPEQTNNNEGLAEEVVLVPESEIQTPGEDFGEVSQGGEIIFGEEGVISTEEVGEESEIAETISTSEEISSVLESENEIISGETEGIISEEQSPEIVIIGENNENIGEISLPEEIIFSETEIPSNESGELIQEEVGLPNNEEFGGNLETESEELIGTIGEENESSLPEELENLTGEEVSISEVTELEGVVIIGEGESTEFVEENAEITELEGVVIIGEGGNTEFTEEPGEITELEGVNELSEESELEENVEIIELEEGIIIGEGEGEGEIPEFTEENAETIELEEGIIIIGEGEGEIPEFIEENAEVTELEEGIIIIGEEGEVSENPEIAELEGIGEIPEFTEESAEITELEEGIIIIGEEGEISENAELTESEEGIVVIGEGETIEIAELEGIPEFTEETSEITELEEGIIIIGGEGEGESEFPGEHLNESELTEGELVIIEVPEGPEIIIIGGNGTGEVILEEVGEEIVVIIETGEGETAVIPEAEVIYGEGGEIIIILPIENWEENPTEIIVITGPGEFEVPNEQTTPPIPVETLIEVSETIIWSEATTIISETTIIETNITEYVIIILETGFGSGSESIEEEVPIIIVEEGEGGSVIEEQTYETVPIDYEAPVDLNFSSGTQVVSIQGGGGGNVDISLGNTGSVEPNNTQNTTSGSSGSTTWPGWPGWTGGSGWSSEPVPEQLGESGELTNWDIQVDTLARSVIQLAPGAQELQTASIARGDFTEVISQVAIEIDDQLFFIDSLYRIRPNYNNIGLAPIIVQAAPKRCQQIESCETVTMPGVGPQNKCKNHLICE